MPSSRAVGTNSACIYRASQAKRAFSLRPHIRYARVAILRPLSSHVVPHVSQGSTGSGQITQSL